MYFLPVIIYRVVYVPHTYGKNAFYYDESLSYGLYLYGPDYVYTWLCDRMFVLLTKYYNLYYVLFMVINLTPFFFYLAYYARYAGKN